MLVLSCGDGAVEPPPPPAPVATTVTVNPGSATLSALGATARFTAEVRNQNGQVMAGATIAWASSDASVATVDASGVATAAANGSATITATAGSASGSAAVTVAQVVSAVAVSPATDTLVAFGDTVRLVAEAIDANGHGVAAATEFSWLSSDTLVARVNDTGLVTGVDEGMATITATAGQYSGAAEITTVENTDRAALVALYEATDGPNWIDNTNWLSHAPLGEWYGVETDASGRVIALRLQGTWDDALRVDVSHGLDGTIPPELGNLAHLEVLDLAINGLTGTIPPELGRLASLEVLYLWRNSLRGVIPPELGGLSDLESLSLERNILSGQIPPELGQLAKLERLDLSWNNLTGQIPPELGNLARLLDLELHWNDLTGPIPQWLPRLAELRGLLLHRNALTGSIPPNLGRLAKLRQLTLDGNTLSGPIPPELGQLTRLHWLWLQDNELTGPIPQELGSLTGLGNLNLSGNNLIGRIPAELGNLTDLGSLGLAGNNLTGRIPPELGNLAGLRRLSLSGNKLTGAFPASFLRLDSLETMGCRRSDGACIPATAEFREWVRQVEGRGNVAFPVDVPFCDEIDKEALEALYNATNGSAWTRSDGWLDDENLDRWHGVRTDSIGRVSGLDLSGNGLSGQIPGALGRLASLTELRIHNNALEGRLPLSLASVSLEQLDYAGTSLCVPDDAGFRDWLNDIPRHSGTGAQCPPLTEREILEELYRSAGGPDWVRSGDWLTDTPLAQWQGVETDAAGSVIGLWLRSNGLTGSLPVELAQLPELIVLNLEGNRLEGRIPPELGDLDRLERLNLGTNRLIGGIPSSLGQLSELRHLALGWNGLSGTVPLELGDLEHLERLELRRNQLVGEIPGELGKLVNLTRLDLGGNFLTGTIPPELGDLDRLQSIDLQGNQLSGNIPSSLGRPGAMAAIWLADNQLSGPIPPALGALGRLSTLDLSGNQLSGSIPSELGELHSLWELRLFSNQLSGSIPPELGDLASLGVLELADNQLAGSIPDQLGDLANLTRLDLANNELAGPLPSALGRASNLASVDLRSNALTGPLPPEFGHLTLLNQLILADNPDLAGPLPPDITELGGLELFMAGGTGLCRPAESRFDAWFRAIPERRLVRCPGGASVYLTQTVQSWDDPVPLLAGKSALLRVFVTAPQGSTATMPAVRATFYEGGGERHTVLIPASTETIPSEVLEGDLALSANAEIPDWVITPGLEIVIEVDPEGRLDPALGVTKRIPDSGRIAVDVREAPGFHLTLVPFLNATTPDSSTLEDVSAMAADPYGHQLLRDVRTLLPIAEIDVVAHEPVLVSTPDMFSILAQVRAMRIMQGGSGYWMAVWDGVLNAGITPAAKGVAYLGDQESASIRHARTIAHELGHNLSLEHAPCGSPDLTDPWFPHADGRTGAWGYDFGQHTLVTPEAADIMSYCFYGVQWISDFFFNKALDHRLAEGGATAAAMAAESDPVRTLLLWGGRDQDGVPYLDPAFVVDATPSLPVAGGEYTIEGATTDGTLVFSLAFDMPHIADAEGRESSFVFALPVQDEWEGDLASITVAGPGGSAVLDETTDQPMTILRDPRTGLVRGFLSDQSPATQAAADAGGSGAGQGMEVLFSRGIPSMDAWRR